MQLAPRHVAAVATLGTLLLAALVAPATAGTQAAPEVTDAPNDQVGPNNTPGCVTQVPGQVVCPVATQAIDLLALWIDNETATSVQVHVQNTAAPPSTGRGLTFTVSFKVGTTAYTGAVSVVCGAPAAGTPCNSALSSTGVAKSPAVTANGVAFTVNKTDIGPPTAGAKLSEIAVASSAVLANTTTVVATDGAGPAGNYTFQGGSGGPTGGDTDADGLNDTWEQQNFGGTAQQNGTGDPEADGCNNACEFQRGTDPKKADTDGDGFSDGDEVKAGSDPKDANSKPQTTTTTSGPPTTGPTTTGPPTSGTTTTTPPQTTDGTKGEPMERLSEGFSEGAFGIGYLIIACALGGLVLLLALIGRFGRWRL